MVEGEGFEPSKPVATDLQSVAFDRFATSPWLALLGRLELAEGIEPPTR